MLPPIKSILFRFRWPLLVVIVTLILIKLMNLTANTPQQEQRREDIPLVEIQHVVAQPDSVQVDLYGVVETPHLVTLRAPVTGYVQMSSVLEGDPIQTGQPLLRIDPKDQQLVIAQYQADVQEAQARLASERLKGTVNKTMLAQEQVLLAAAEREYKRQLSLNNKDLVAKSRVDTAQAEQARQQLALLQRQQQIDDHSNQLQLLEAQLARKESLLAKARFDLERSELKAPYAGRITSLLVTAGERVQAGDVLVEFYGDDSLEIRAQIPDRYLPGIRVLQEQNRSVNAYLKGGENRWQLHRLTADVKEGRGGVDGLFRPLVSRPVATVLGRPVALTLEIPLSSDVVRIEPRSLYDNRFVYRVLNDNTLEAVSVEMVGSTIDKGREFIVVESPDLTTGDRLLRTRIANVITGLKVRAAEANAGGEQL